MVNIGTRVARVENIFSTSRNAALIESKMLQYTTLSTKCHHRTLCEPRTHAFTYQTFWLVPQNLARSNNNNQTRFFI